MLNYHIRRVNVPVSESEYKLTCDFSRGTSEYGIALYEYGELQNHLPQLSENRADIESLTALLNDLKVEACHFEDVVEDYLTDFSV